VGWGVAQGEEWLEITPEEQEPSLRKPSLREPSLREQNLREQNLRESRLGCWSWIFEVPQPRIQVPPLGRGSPLRSRSPRNPGSTTRGIGYQSLGRRRKDQCSEGKYP